MTPSTFDILYKDEVIKLDLELELGGVYSIIINENDDKYVSEPLLWFIVR